MRDCPSIVATYGCSNHDVTAETGPIVSLKELMVTLENGFSFTVLAQAHFGLPNRAEVPASVNALCRWLRQQPHDLLYLNSFFDREFTVPILFLRRAGLIPKRPILLSPRGEFSEGAQRQKCGKKQAYIDFARRAGLLRGVWFHATGLEEEEDIRRVLPLTQQIFVAPNIRSLRTMPAPSAPQSGHTRIVFLSRIDRKKNLDFALAVLAQVQSPVRFDIYGPITHPGYWDECLHLIALLPPHVEVRYLGAIANDDVPSTLAAYDLFFLPTLGENFGHAIFDALEVGLPVLVSDRTPWRDLEDYQAGWSLPLSAHGPFVAAIQRWASLSAREREALRFGARALAECYVQQFDAANSYRQIFHCVIAGHDACGRLLAK